uniref:Uncharacterized protein n=1 Tax=viral metagenome TaxID=1070528 RepID=A0A6C0JZ73_9ZZZZ
MNNSSSTASLSSIQTVNSTITNSLLLSPSKSELSFQELSSSTPDGSRESNLVLMPGDSAFPLPSEAKPSELRSRVSLSALQNQLLQLQGAQEKLQQQQEQEQQKQQTQPILRQLQSRILNVSSADASLFKQALQEFHETTRYWGWGTSG